MIMFSLATASILHCYSDSCGEHRDIFRSKYLNVLDFILGNTGACIVHCCRHLPSAHRDSVVQLQAWNRARFPMCPPPETYWDPRQRPCRGEWVASWAAWICLARRASPSSRLCVR